MASISELKRDGIGSPIDLRIIRKWRHDVRRHETWFIDINKLVSEQKTIATIKEVYTSPIYKSDNLFQPYYFFSIGRCDTDPRTADKSRLHRIGIECIKLLYHLRIQMSRIRQISKGVGK